MSYAQKARKAYGESCEYEGCGWKEAPCDVHHIDYPLHIELENSIRNAHRESKMESVEGWTDIAKKKGFKKFDVKTMQLSKDDRVSNLAVLCPNHHRIVHEEDMGLSLLMHIPKRKTLQS